MILELIKNRRAVFPAQYNGMAIASETIEIILEAANWAPTHKRTEPWRFKVVRGEARERLGVFLSETYLQTEKKPKNIKAKKLLQKPMQSEAVILICMQRDPEQRIPEWEEIASTAMAVQNMWLMCTELGIGCYWSSPALISHMDGFTVLQDGEKCLGLFYLGYYDEILPEGERTPVGEKVSWID